MATKKKIIFYVLFILTIILALFLRLFKLGEIPAGVYLDEASLGYNAYSLLLTGRDEFGKNWPIYFRAFTTFQDSLYGYLSVVPIYFLGLSVFSTRLLSALAGTTVVVISILLFIYSDIKNKYLLAIASGVTVALAPWAVYQSRVAVGSNLGLALTAVSAFILYLSLERKRLFSIACLLFGIASYAYAGQRITSVLIPATFVLINFREYLKDKFQLGVGFSLLILVMLPQFTALKHTGSLIRYKTQGYTSQETYNKYGGGLKNLPILGRPIYILKQFSSQYISTFSPRSLFFDPEPQLVRSIPGLSVFYTWMIIPFFIGLGECIKERKNKLIETIFIIIFIGILPEALTGDPFYTLRFLPAIWGMTMVVSIGMLSIFNKIISFPLKIMLIISTVAISIINLYVSYFVILKHERSIYFGYPFEKFAQITESNKDKLYILDSETFDAPYIWMAFYKSYDPVKIQKQSPIQINGYYDNLTFNKYRQIGNVEVRKIDWAIDQCSDKFIVGDIYAISDPQATEHKFTLIQNIKDLDGNTTLRIFKTNPQSVKCN